MEQEQEAPVNESVEYDSAEEATETEEVAETAETEQEPEQEEKPSRVEFSEEQQKYINDHIIGRQVAKRKEVERELEELRKRATQAQPQQEEGRPVIPEPPSVWDDDYEKKIQARDDAIRAAASWDARQQARQEYEQEQQRAQQQQQHQELLKKVTTYTERAKKSGIDESDLQMAGNAVAQYGIPEQLVQFIIDDDAGPAITMHLSKNIAELDALNRMDPIRAAVYIATEIKPKATRNAQRRMKPPEPTDSPRGSGVPEKNRGPEGATYE